jgi:predicted helicase
MIEGADWLCEKHFGRNLADENVEILDPATGTGTFICELLEHFRGQPKKLKRKYQQELHANEVAILPYYVANLNIEATYAAITGEYEEFHNLCFVDTLDNVGLHTAAHGTTADLFGSVSEENVARIKRQNSRKISVVIGNPPYNANQANENDNNKNREYPGIDARIKQTYIAESTAQKTKLYDMYARFFRWASDRLAADGVLAFVTNRSFIDSRTFDGFRKIVAKEFNEIWLVDLKGDARTSGERRRQEGGNVFDDQIRVGVAISFFVRKQGASGCRIRYACVRDYAKSDEKREFLVAKRLREHEFDEVRPDAKANWIGNAANDFDELLPVIDKGVKAEAIGARDRAIFKLFGNGLNTARDDWVTDFSEASLAEKVRYFLTEYASAETNKESSAIKWSRNLKQRKSRGLSEAFSPNQVRRYGYRPFLPQYGYVSKLLIDELGQWSAFNVPGNRSINFPAAKGLSALASDLPTDFHFTGDTKVAALYRTDDSGQRHDNITDWALKQFQQHYAPGKGRKPAALNKEAIFHYVYAVLHDPVYREKYAQNLKREFPRVPLYGSTVAHFEQWAAWGQALMALHIGYEAVDPWDVTRTDTPDTKARAAGQAPKSILKSVPEEGRVLIDSETVLAGIPPEAWSYKLGNRSALDWVLDQHKERKPKDPTIREKFDTYRFADHKERVITLLARVARVSVETVQLVEALKGGPR